MNADLIRYRTQLLSAMGLASLALTGCDTTGEALPGDALPPPLVLSGGLPLTGTSTNWAVSGATPGQQVFLAVSPTTGAGPCPAPLGGECLDLVNPYLVGSATADGNGDASIDILLPSVIPDGTAVNLQAAQGGPQPAVSNVLSDAADHPLRVCGDFEEPNPTNYWSYTDYMLCMPEPASGNCPTYTSLPWNGVNREWAQQAGLDRATATLFDVVAVCDETSVEDRCCYGVQVFQIAIGRPFTVAGEARVATPSRDPSWSAEVALDVSELPRRVRRRLAKHWARTAHGEHASVASFARFQLHLMQLGAPADLVADATRAMADEVRHARQAFAVAGALAGEPMGPGPLDTSGAGDLTDLADIVVAAVREGCIAETIAAAEVAEAARRCTVPVLAEILATTAADEQRHAALAWRFVRWALSEHPELRDAVAAAFTEGVATQPMPLDPDGAALAAWGVLDEPTAHAVADRVFHEVVRPCAAELLSRVPTVAVA